MKLEGLNIGLAMTGSFCTIEECMYIVKEIVKEGANVIPILSEIVATSNTRFTNSEKLISDLYEITGNKVIKTVQEAEPIGPKKLLDLIIVLPCTGNTLSKITHAITDTSVTMAVKANLRNEKPVVIAISTNDGLGANAQNIGALLNTKNIYLVPFYQDDPILKSKSLIADFNLSIDTIIKSLDNKQIQPIILTK